MTLQPSAFIEGRNWVRIPRSERNGRPWKYRLITDWDAHSDTRLCHGHYYFYDADGICWGSVHPSSITVSSGYAWNGSSVSPDWPRGILQKSLPHDLLYQFSGCKNFPLTRNQVDRVFTALPGNRIAYVYYSCLIAGGWVRWGQHKPGDHILT